MSAMIGNPEECIHWLFNQDRDKVFEISEHKEKRSNRANSYAWEMIGKLADVLRLPKEEVYFHELKKYGQSEVVNVLSCVNAGRFFKYSEELSTFTYQGQEWSELAVYLGSSQYNTKEMSIFIDGIVEDCKEQGISTLPPEEIERLKEMWKP